jgi:hypothetical protein
MIDFSPELAVTLLVFCSGWWIASAGSWLYFRMRTNVVLQTLGAVVLWSGLGLVAGSMIYMEFFCE